MSVEIIHGDCLAAMELLPSESVHCIVTSPPYWGLRDYGTATWEGGDPFCDHRSPTMREGRNEDRAKLAGSSATNSYQLLLAHRTGCGKCGAVKVDQQIGLETSLGEHIDMLVRLFREARRVLRKDGTFWLNYGDAYASAPNGRSAADTKTAGSDDRTFRDKPISTVGGMLKPKDRMMLPARVAIALQEDGWWLRDEIVWHKPNPMPSSVKDRTTPAHEMIYMFSKSERYYYEQQIEPYATPPKARANKTGSRALRGQEAIRPRGNLETGPADRYWPNAGKNKRSVWTISPKAFPEAHFATFPPDLIRPCITAGCPAGGTVLDPFFGAGTTGLVAEELGRNCIGFELNGSYIEIAKRRLGLVDMGAFA